MNNDDLQFTDKINRAIATTKEMMVQRGFSIIKETEEHIVYKNNKHRKVLIFKTLILKFNTDKVKECISIINEQKIKQCIVIYTECITPMAKKLVKTSIEHSIELFNLSELQYNITKHRLVPKHIRLTLDESKEFKKRFGSKHPTLLKTDPISRFYNFKRGDIIRVIRSSNGNNYIAYRIVKGQ